MARELSGPMPAQEGAEPAETTEVASGQEDTGQTAKQPAQPARRTLLTILLTAVAATAITAGSLMYALGQSNANEAWMERAQFLREPAPLAAQPAGIAAQPPAAQSGTLAAPPPAVEGPSNVKLTGGGGEAGDESGRRWAISFEATTMDGRDFELEETKGGPTLLAFWTHW